MKKKMKNKIEVTHTPGLRAAKMWARKAPHAVTDPQKLTRMIETLISGGALPPVLWDGNQAYEGSHRLAAWESVEQDPDLIIVTNDDLARAADRLGMDAADVDWFDEDNLAVLRAEIKEE